METDGKDIIMDKKSGFFVDLENKPVVKDADRAKREEKWAKTIKTIADASKIVLPDASEIVLPVNRHLEELKYQHRIQEDAAETLDNAVGTLDKIEENVRPSLKRTLCNAIIPTVVAIIGFALLWLYG